MTETNNNKKPLILALDIATNCGWAEGRAGDAPTCGSVRLAPEGSPRQAVGAGMIKFLGQRLQAFRPNIIVVESPIGVMGAQSLKGGVRTNAKSLEMLLGLVWIAESVAYACGCHEPRRVAVSTARKHFIGHGRLPGPQAKQAVFKRCQQLGYNPTDLDASDACCLWDYTAAQYQPKIVDAKTGNLFGRRG